MTIRRDIYVNAEATGPLHAADCAIEEVDGRVRRVGFRYRAAYLDHPGAFAIDPVALPLRRGEFDFRCDGGVPGFLDDHLPDDWGRKVLARAAFHAGDERFDANCVSDLMRRMGHSQIGALSLVESGAAPGYEFGAPLSALRELEEEALRTDGASPLGEAGRDMDETFLLRLLFAASSVGGARPKALVFDDGGRYLAKFNRRRTDDYNHARVELACLDMARAAGVEVARGRVVACGPGRDALVLDRFDVSEHGRHHLVSVNGLLKDPATQRDRGVTFRYDDIADLIRRHSCCVTEDLPALVRLMAFNRAINNTDDHERNFSLIHRGDGYRLSPAYDLTPSLALGAYHAAGIGHWPAPPAPSELTKLGRVFGLSKPRVRGCAEEVAAAVERWPEFAGRAGVGEEETNLVARCICR